MQDDNVNPYTKISHGRYTWCGGCQQANLTAGWEMRRWQCPGCSTLGTMARPWEELQSRNQGYPAEPARGMRYAARQQPKRKR